MTRSREDDSNAERMPPKRSGALALLLLVIVCAIAAGYAAVRHFFGDSAAIHEIHVGTSVLRVPAPRGAQQIAFESIDRSMDAQATFANVGKNNDEIRYDITYVNDEILTEEQFSTLVAEVKREYSGVSSMLRAQYVSQAIFRRSDIRIKRVDVRQYEERGGFVRRVKGETSNYGVTVYLDSAQLLFLFRDRPYVITVLASSSSSLSRDLAKEAWAWHGAILAANAGDS